MTEEQRPYEVKTIDRRPNFEPDSTLAVAGHSPADMMALAMNKGMDLNKLEQMLVLQERWEANEAKKAYTDAMSQFKANPPEIEKDRTVRYEAGGKTVEYTHASLANVTKKINTGLGKYGLSAAWVTVQTEKGITVTCTITHKLGHSESTSLTAGADTSGSKNSIQAIGSTISYLERYTLLAITGLATADMDDDGINPVEYITEKQVADIGKIINEKNVDKTKFLAYMGIDEVEHIPAKEYGKAMGALKVAKGKLKTIPCPERDGKDVDVKVCETCTSRTGCPSWG